MTDDEIARLAASYAAGYDHFKWYRDRSAKNPATASETGQTNESMRKKPALQPKKDAK